MRGPSPLPSLPPRRPPPTHLSARRRTGLEARHTFPAQSSSSARRAAGTGPGSLGPRRPAPPGRPAPAPLRSPPRRQAGGAEPPDPPRPEPLAGPHKGPVSWRRSGGNQPGPRPAAPLPIQLAPAPPPLLLRARRGAGGGPWVLPFLQGLGGGSEEEGPGPGGRPPDKHLSPPPRSGPRASHSWTSGSGRRREQRRPVGDRRGTTSCVPLVF